MDKILSAVAITLLVIGPLHLANALIGQQPTTPPNVPTPPATRPPAANAPPTKARATTTPATTTPATTAPGGKQPAILMLSEAECRDDKQSPKKECELGDIIFVTCDNLSAWMNDPSAKNTPKDLVLVLDGRVMKGRGAMGPYNSQNELKFDLRRLEGDDVDGKANRDAWSAPPPAPSQGFLLDILRDETGVSFHRFQMAAWTVVLGFVFAVAVYRSLAMRDFSATLLALMSISSGTYMGFKISDPPKSS